LHRRRTAIVVVGDHNKTTLRTDRAAPTGELDLACVLGNDAGAAKAFANRLAKPGDKPAQRKFDRAIARATTQDILGAFLDNADFGTDDTKVRRFLSYTKVSNAEVVTLGVGNRTRSHITVRARKVASVDVTGVDEAVASSVSPGRGGITRALLDLPQPTSSVFATSPQMDSATPPSVIPLTEPQSATPLVANSPTPTQPAQMSPTRHLTADEVDRAAVAAFRRKRRLEDEEKDDREEET